MRERERLREPVREPERVWELVRWRESVCVGYASLLPIPMVPPSYLGRIVSYRIVASYSIKEICTARTTANEQAGSSRC